VARAEDHGEMTHPDRQDRQRWLASGLADAAITIMLRDGTLPPPHAARWYDSSLSTEEIVAFRRAGRMAPDAAFASSLEARGLPTDAAFLETWDGFDAERILQAIDRGFTSGAQFAPWSATDADATEVQQLAGAAALDGFDAGWALRQLRAGRTPEQIVYALESGLKPKRALVWMERGLSAGRAREWSTAGFSAEEAAAWIEVSEDPEVARLLEAVGFDLVTARERRPHDGWTLHAVRRHAVVEAGAPDDRADEWASTPIPTRKLGRWVASGVQPGDAAQWLELGVRADEAAGWVAHGFGPDAANDWRRSGIGPEAASRRRDAGVRPPSPTD
jgi:hypothetical protein